MAQFNFQAMIDRAMKETIEKQGEIIRELLSVIKKDHSGEGYQEWYLGITDLIKRAEELELHPSEGGAMKCTQTCDECLEIQKAGQGVCRCGSDHEDSLETHDYVETYNSTCEGLHPEHAYTGPHLCSGHHSLVLEKQPSNAESHCESRAKRED